MRDEGEMVLRWALLLFQRLAYERWSTASVYQVIGCAVIGCGSHS
jgi:hypothetical protein